MKKVVFWQNTISIHQAPLLKSLSELNYDVKCITEEDLPHKRKSMGWEMPDYGNTDLFINPDKNNWNSLVKKFDLKKTVHIFSGFNTYNLPTYAYKNLTDKSSLKGIFTEPWKNTDLLKYPRLLRSAFKRLTYGDSIDFILATGPLAFKQLKLIGFQNSKIFPFGYFVRHPNENELSFSIPAKKDNLQFLFVGQLIFRKGVDTLLDAFANLESDSWQLDIIGSGKSRENYWQRTKCKGLGSKVNFRGRLPNDEVFKHLQEVDYLVLPSRYDGWGAVVNEALTVGTPCIVSDNCGSSDLIQSNLQGAIFESGSIGDLTSILRKVINEQEITSWEERKKLIKWSKKHISSSIGAVYLSDIINFVDGLYEINDRPVKPWKI